MFSVCVERCRLGLVSVQCVCVERCRLGLVSVQCVCVERCRLGLVSVQCVCGEMQARSGKCSVCVWRDAGSVW